jgi:DNA-binding PucR family transcriptional regulator
LGRFSHLLAYDLDGSHLAAVIWTTDPDLDIADLERVGRDLTDRAPSRTGLRLLASAGTIWLWMSDTKIEMVRDVRVPPEVRIAIGTEGQGVDGFRRSHLDALSTQRLLARLASDKRVAAFDEVEPVLALTENPERADAFVRRTLGDLESASADLRETVLAYVEEGSNAQATASRLYAHRNTVIRRLERADQLLPRPLRDNPVRVALALEVVRWRGPTSGHMDGQLPRGRSTVDRTVL